MRFLASTLCVLGVLFMGGESVAKDDPQLIDPQMCQTLAIQTRETSSNLTVLNSLMRDMRNPQVANEDLERHYETMNRTIPRRAVRDGPVIDDMAEPLREE